MPGPLTNLVLGDMATTADDVALTIETTPPLDHASFCDAVQALLQIGTHPVEIARAMKVSVPTVLRWGNGTTSPHDLLLSASGAALAGVARAQALTWRMSGSQRTPDWKRDRVFPTMEALFDAFTAGTPIEIVQGDVVTPVTTFRRGDEQTPTGRWIVNDGEIQMSWIVFGGDGDGSSRAHFSTMDLTIRIAPRS